MKNQIDVQTNNVQKAIIINILFASTIIIMLLGISFSVFCVANNISF